MPTLAQLKKKAKELGFVEKVECLGFTLGPSGFWFYRKRGEFLDVFDFWMKSSMKWVEVPVVCFIDEIIDENYNMDDFPKGFIKGFSNLTQLYACDDGVEIYGSAWKVAEDEEISSTFTRLYEIVERDMDTWFQSMDSKEKVLKSIE